MFVNTLQKINNFLYEKLGFNNLILKLQIYINTQRAKKDVPDETQIIAYDGEQPYTQ